MAGVKGKSGGFRPGAGRKPQKPILIEEAPKDSASAAEESPEVIEVVLASDGKDPIEFLEAVMLNPGLDAKLRIDAAKALLPFKHVRKGEAGKKETRQEAAKKAGSGKFASSAPPLRVVKSR